MRSFNLAKRPGTLLSLALCTLSLGIASAAPPRREAKVDLDSARRSAVELRTLLARAAKDAGGDLERQHMHLVLGFSTGHYSSDPLSAEAARHIASSLVTDFVVPDDHLSAYAYEMDLWDHPQAGRNGAPVPADKSQDLDLWPLTPQSGSPGGHDTERAITRIADKVGTASDVVIVLLTNTAASISVPGQRVIGANSPEYQSILNRWQRLPQVNKSGASAVLPFTVINPDGSSIGRSLDAVILVPKAFSGAPLAAPRAQLLQSTPAVVPLPPPPPAPKFDPKWLLLVAALGALGFGLWFVLKNLPDGKLLLVVQDSTFDLQTHGDGSEICHLAGPGFPEPNERTLTVSGMQAPPQRFARFIKERDGSVRVRSEHVKLRMLDGAQVDGTCIIKGEGSHRLTFSGEVQPNPALPPQVVSIEIPVQLKRPA